MLALKSLFALRALLSLQRGEEVVFRTLVALGDPDVVGGSAVLTVSTTLALRALFALQTLFTLRTGRTLFALQTLFTLWTGRTLQCLNVRRIGGQQLGDFLSGSAILSGRPLLTTFTLGTLFTTLTLRTLLATLALRSLFTLRTLLSLQ